jgi:hypothetical protein
MAAGLSGAATHPQHLLREEAFFRFVIGDEYTSRNASKNLTSQALPTA